VTPRDMRTLKDIEHHYTTKISELTENWMAWRKSDKNEL
jgi:hypothetical protein